MSDKLIGALLIACAVVWSFALGMAIYKGAI
jgi:hypothetical protein